ncbi:hypothetical protein BC943DRAFT_335046 [Umbelopsis sp. AD052]|nr:hypothetical protein BC943DRAFT_335046 [Umbelopsis sp. AD052]
MQTSAAPDVKHPLPLAKSTLSVAAEHRRPSLGYLFAPLNVKSTETSSTSSTNRLILDYLLFISIQSRLRQADIGLNTQEDDDSIKRWTDAGIRANKDHIAVESIIHGVKSTSQSKIPLQFDGDLKQRIYLCQLTNFVFGRFDSNIVPTTKQRKYPEPWAQTDQSPPSDLMNQRQHMFAAPIAPMFCRRHRNQPCMSCRSKMAPQPQKLEGRAGTIIASGDRTSRRRMTLASPPSAGLIDAIPSFLKTSASMLRRTLDRSEESAEPLVVAGEKVIGGGMPATWYDLFLELLTQAAIESYLCDGGHGLEFIFEIFSYGDVDEDGNDDDDDDDDDADEEDDEEDWLSVKAADHHLLFPKTRTIYLFAKKLREREQEFLDVKDDLRSHFEQLAQKYKLDKFEHKMRGFIEIAHQSMDQPAMNKYERTEAIEPIKRSTHLPRTSPNMPVASLQASTVAPSLLEFPSDGSLLMPEVPDSDEEDDEQAAEGQLESATPKKRKRASSSLTTTTKRTRRTRNSIDSPTKIPRQR